MFPAAIDPGLARHIDEAKKKVSLWLSSLGIRGKLASALGASAALVLIMGFVNVISLWFIGSNLDRIGSHAVPSFTKAFELARSVTEAARLSAEKAAASTKIGADAITSRLEVQIAEIRAGVDALLLHSGDSSRSPLPALVGEVEDTSRQIGKAVQERIEQAAALGHMVGTAFGAHRGMSELLAPLMDESAFELNVTILDLEKQAANRQLKPAVQKVEADLAALQSFAELRAETNLVLGILVEAAMSPNADILQPLQDRLEASASRMRKGLRGLGQHAQIKQLTVPADTLLGLCAAQGGIVETRRRELEARTRATASAELGLVKAAALSAEVQSAVQLARSLTDRAVEDARGTIVTSTAAIVLLLLAATFVTALAWFFVSQQVVKRLVAITRTVKHLASGNLDVEIERTGRDELADLAGGLVVFRDNAVKAHDLEAEKQAELAIREERQRMFAEAAEAFDRTGQKLAEGLSSAALEIGNTAATMLSLAQSTSRDAVAVTSSSENANSSVQGGAAATEQMAASVREIASNMRDAAAAAENAAEEAGNVKQTINQLAAATAEIGSVADLIDRIAKRSSLLALNATIEAARAGEAGKGFAVVANEVKNLALQTQESTGEIKQRVEQIQVATAAAVTGVGGIVATVQRINELNSSVSSAVTQQQSATDEVARSVMMAANASKEVGSKIRSVANAASTTQSAAGSVFEAAKSLGDNAESVKKEIVDFLQKIRPAQTA